MCGISGIYHPGGNASLWEKPLRALTRGLTHRGPDEEGFYSAPSISFGMRRLKVIDLKTGAQPISNETNQIWVIFNGEIYGFEDLRKSLQHSGHTFKTQSDTEVLVHLYEDYGLDFLNHIDGMFAFALWDIPRQRLIVARDRFGIKPLFYTVPHPKGQFAFASELHPLLQMPGLTRTLDPIALDQFFTLSYILHPRSIYKEIRKLSPGSYLRVEGSNVQEVRYWDVPHSDSFYDLESAGPALDQAISASVKSMMRSDVPVGAFLSGGLDSSTVVSHMVQHAPHVQTFSVRFSEPHFDEGDLARRIATYLGTTHHEIHAVPNDLRKLPTLVDHFGEPFADPSQIPTYLVSKLARRHVTVALSGDGGDEILGGYETYVASLLASRIGRLPSRMRRALLWMSHQIPVSTKHHLGIDYKIRKFLIGCHLPPVEHHAAWRTIYDRSLKDALYSSEFRHHLGSALEEPIFKQWTKLFENPGRDRLNLYQLLDINTYLVDNNLTKVDRMSMAHSLEVRIPLLDLRVATTALRIPPCARTHLGQTKIILRKLMRGRLPPDILHQPKRGFAVPLSSWFLGPLEEFVNEQLHPDRIRRTGVLNSEAVQSLIQAHRARKNNFSRQLWNLICFVSWYEKSGLPGF